VPVLGFSALQLSPDRDPLAPHADPKRAGDVDLRSLVARGVLRGLPSGLLSAPPRIEAPTPTARAALGYLHGNCGHCHNAAGALAGLELVLAQQADGAAHSAERTLESLLGHSSRFRPHGSVATQRIAADPGSSVLTLRMKTDNPLARMPPLGVRVVDSQGVALIERWIASDLNPALSTFQETSR
jgi:mono/diheme cytochrome c family protein